MEHVNMTCDVEKEYLMYQKTGSRIYILCHNQYNSKTNSIKKELKKTNIFMYKTNYYMFSCFMFSRVFHIYFLPRYFFYNSYNSLQLGVNTQGGEEIKGL